MFYILCYLDDHSLTQPINYNKIKMCEDDFYQHSLNITELSDANGTCFIHTLR